jgi:hypothetical protein
MCIKRKVKQELPIVSQAYAGEHYTGEFAQINDLRDSEIAFYRTSTTIMKAIMIMFLTLLAANAIVCVFSIVGTLHLGNWITSIINEINLKYQQWQLEQYQYPTP